MDDGGEMGWELEYRWGVYFLMVVGKFYFYIVMGGKVVSLGKKVGRRVVGVKVGGRSFCIMVFVF